MIQDLINIANDFSPSPAGRYRTDGDTSGQAFLEDILENRFKKAIQGNYEIEVELDGVWWLPPSFISASFGQLSLNYWKEKVLKHLHLSATEYPMRKDEVIEQIMNPESTWRM